MSVPAVDIMLCAAGAREETSALRQFFGVHDNANNFVVKNVALK